MTQWVSDSLPSLLERLVTLKSRWKKWGQFLKIPQFLDLCLITQTHNFETLINQIWVMPKAFYVREIWKRPDVLDFCGYFLARGLTIISVTFHVMLISVKFQAMVILVAFQRPPLSGACHDLREREREGERDGATITGINSFSHSQVQSRRVQFQSHLVHCRRFLSTLFHSSMVWHFRIASLTLRSRSSSIRSLYCPVRKRSLKKQPS